MIKSVKTTIVKITSGKLIISYHNSKGYASHHTKHLSVLDKHPMCSHLSSQISIRSDAKNVCSLEMAHLKKRGTPVRPSIAEIPCAELQKHPRDTPGIQQTEYAMFGLKLKVSSTDSYTGHCIQPNGLFLFMPVDTQYVDAFVHSILEFNCLLGRWCVDCLLHF